MLIIPFENNQLNWRKPPVMSLLLIAINCLVFFMYQTGDPERFASAEEIYNQNDLYDLEKDLFQSYISQNPPDDSSDIDTSNEMFVYQMLLWDAEFSEYLKTYWEEHPDKTDDVWKDTRRRFEEARGNISIFRFGFIPAHHDPVTLVTHMFLHGGLEHLIGNMIFLFIFGFALEVVIGRGKFLLLYLITGLCAVYGYMAFNLESFGPLVGASGAIAGLMGMYFAAYGLRKIRFFYFVGFYFGEFTAPAVLIFPYWLGKEIYAQQTTTDNVAYIAHASGLLGGFLIVLALKFLGSLKVNTDYKNEDDKQDDVLNEKLASINQLFSELQTDRARSLCKKALEEYPGNTELWGKYYNLWKIEPKNKAFHEVAFTIFKLAKHQDTNMGFIGEIVKSYLEIAPKPVALNGPVCVLLAQRFKKTGNTELVEKMVDRAVQHNVNNDSMPVLLGYLVHHFENEKNSRRANQYRATLKEHYPDFFSEVIEPLS
jgi:membrane associated rhomboid family serine protease